MVVPTLLIGSSDILCSFHNCRCLLVCSLARTHTDTHWLACLPVCSLSAHCYLRFFFTVAWTICACCQSLNHHKHFNVLFDFFSLKCCYFFLFFSSCFFFCRCLTLSKFYTIFIYYFSVSFLLLWLFHSSFILSFSFFLVWIINLRIKLKSFFINILRFSWPFIGLMCYTHTHSHQKFIFIQYEHYSNLHLWSHSNTTNAFARIKNFIQIQKAKQKKNYALMYEDKMTKLFISKIGNLHIAGVYGAGCTLSCRVWVCVDVDERFCHLFLFSIYDDVFFFLLFYTYFTSQFCSIKWNYYYWIRQTRWSNSNNNSNIIIKKN